MANNRITVLKRSSDFERIKLSGKKIVPCRWLLIGFLKNDSGHCRVGWTVSTKVGTAVTRNKLKRWCRNYFKSADFSLKSDFDINIVFRPTQQNDFYKELKFHIFKETLDKAFKNV